MYTCETKIENVYGLTHIILNELDTGKTHIFLEVSFSVNTILKFPIVNYFGIKVLLVS